MKIGCPKEIKPQEFRVGMTPNAAREAVLAGHAVMIETGAGVGAGFTDGDYIAAGAAIIGTAAEVFAANADIVGEGERTAAGGAGDVARGAGVVHLSASGPDPDDAGFAGLGRHRDCL